MPILNSTMHREKSSPDARRAWQEGAGKKGGVWKKLKACEGMQGRMQL